MEIINSNIFEFVKFGIAFGFSIAAFWGMLGKGINTLFSVFNIVSE